MIQEGSFMEALKSVLKWIDKSGIISGYSSAVITIIFALMIAISVVSRYAFREPIFWVDEVSTYLFLASMLLQIPYATYTESHVSADIVFMRFPRRLQYGITQISYLLALVASGIIVYHGIRTTLRYIALDYHSETTLLVPLVLIFVFIPLGFALIFLQILACIYKVHERMST
jgi:TRAP-type C4-dicarboxylate transport system permease small subunit